MTLMTWMMTPMISPKQILHSLHRQMVSQAEPHSVVVEEEWECLKAEICLSMTWASEWEAVLEVAWIALAQEWEWAWA